jgi:CheY-like chemotaxis protein
MKSKILIVEDNHDVRENLSEILNLSGYQSITANNGKQGVEIALAEIPDLILCDIMMPELDGYGVLRILSKNPLTEHIPFIFLSAKTELMDIRKGMTMGADDYITKPFDDVELLDTIELRLNRRKSGAASTAEHRMVNLISPEQLLESLPAALLDGEIRHVNKKDTLYSEGQTCRNVFLVKSGRAAATKMDEYSKEVVTHLYQSPMIIGVPSALVGKYRETIKAMEDLTVLPIKKDDFIQFILQDRQVSFYFLNQLALNQVRADEKLLLQAFGTVRMKLASTLLELYPLYEKNGESGNSNFS